MIMTCRFVTQKRVGGNYPLFYLNKILILSDRTLTHKEKLVIRKFTMFEKKQLHQSQN
jgi:hypothetical protein